MKNFQFLTILSLVFMLWACREEIQTVEDVTDMANPELTDLQDKAQQAIDEIEADYQNPPLADGASSRAVVRVSAESVNAIAAAIDAAGNNGTVILESGDHYEMGTVEVTTRVKIVGEDNAVVHFDILPPEGYGTSPVSIETGFYVKNVTHVEIRNLDIRPLKEEGGSMAIFLQNARYVSIVNNTISSFRFAVWASNSSDYARIYNNTMNGIEGGGWGIAIESGTKAKIMGNSVENWGTAIFMSSSYGISYNNSTRNSGVGFLFCTVQGNFLLPDGKPLVNAESCNGWVAINNSSSGCYWNYLIIDGANKNLCYQNTSTNAGLYDIEAAGPTSRFGIPSPTSSENWVVSVGKYKDYVVKDCGAGNSFIGGQMVNNADDPCF